MIGLTGPMRGGKDTTVSYLKKCGFIPVSLSDEVRKEAHRQNLTEDRTTLQNIGDSLRKKLGASILAKRAVSAIANTSSQRVVINGIRNPEEIIFLRSRFPDIKIIGITADMATRKKRAMEEGGISEKEFAMQERRDRGVGQGIHGNRVDKCLALADIVIENEGSVEMLQKKVDKILGNLSSRT